MAEATNPITTASNPRVGEDVGRELERLSAAATQGLSSVHEGQPDDHGPEGGGGFTFCLGQTRRTGGGRVIHKFGFAEDIYRSHSPSEWAEAEATIKLLSALWNAYRSGKLVASTGSGKEETKGEPPAGSGSREPGPTVPASGFDPSRAALRALRIGDMVRVNQSLDQPWTFDWQDGPYEVIGLALDRHGDPTVTLSHDGDVGSDGFDPSDLVLVAPCDGSAEGGETGTGSTEGNSAVREAEAPEATPRSSPSQTPVDPQMTVEEARALLDGIRDPVRLAANFRKAGNDKDASHVEAALRTLQAAGEVRHG